MLGLLSRFRYRAPDANPTEQMSVEDRAVIIRFAMGENDLRDKAIGIHRRYVDQIGVRGDMYQRFMAEVDNPAPDYGLRHVYRQQILNTPVTA